jgi:ERCC4-type nuclease
MEENRLTSAITVEAVRQSLEEHLADLSQEIKHPEELIRDQIDRHPGRKQQRELLDSIPGIAETTAALLLSEITDIKQYASAPGSRLRWISAQRAPIGDKCEGADETVKALECSAQASALLSGHHGY